MKTIAKLGLIGLALAASSAHADVLLPGSGNGELTLFVRNDVTGAVYARGLQINLDGVLNQAAIDAPYTGNTATGLVQQFGYSLSTIGPDANLSGFLNQTDTFSWTIMAGDNQGGNAASPDARRYVTTTQRVYDTLTPNTTVTNNSLGTTWNNLQAMMVLVNQNIGTGVVGDGSSTASNGQWRQTGAVPGSIAGNWFGAGADTVNALGTAANFYVMTSSGAGGARARIYQGLDVILNADGSLSSVGAPPVPLPAAAWMLMSGLVTLAGVGRRKNAAVAAA